MVLRRIAVASTSAPRRSILSALGVGPCLSTQFFLSSTLAQSKSPNAHQVFVFQATRSFSSPSSWNWTKTVTSSLGGPLAAAENVEGRGENNGGSMSDAESVAQREVLGRCASLHSSIMPLNDKLRGPLARDSDRGTSLPFVFLVGNHSSGKSSFINYVLGRRVQTAGVAPTDDTFTVIAPGPTDVDQDGPAVIGDPDMGFSQLRQFGPSLVHHTQLKVRSGINTQNFMMVDSPGMIDSPVSAGGMTSSSDGAIMDRGYDFQGVVRWFAERADIVMLFFDPDKPGTTGETLSVLLHSLSGMDHKLLIVLNKADQFRKIHDFARAYGSLCWNLSKVIPRKDLPRIFTMCLPVSSQTQGGAANSPALVSGDQPQPIGQGLADLHQTRDDVVAEVMKAPKRRVDNVITHLNDSVHLLLMHARIIEEVRSQYRKTAWEGTFKEAGALTIGLGLAAAGTYGGILPAEIAGGAVAASVLCAGGLQWFHTSELRALEERLTDPEGLGAAFRRTHAREVGEADEYAASVWQRIRDPLRMSLASVGLANIPSVSESEIGELRHMIDEEIPALRRLASPTHFGTKKDA